MELEPKNIYSKESEAVVLACCLENNNLMTKVMEIISIEDFQITYNKNIFTLMLELFANGEAFDSMVLYTKHGKVISNNGGITYLTELTGYNIIRTLDSHLKNMKRLSNLRKLAITAKSISERCYQDNANPKELIAEMNDKLMIMSSLHSNNLFSIGDVLLMSLEEIEKAQKEGGIVGKRTGFEKLDTLTNGLKKGEYVVIGARPSMGKTAFALNIISSLDADTKSLLVECDMSITAVGSRLFALSTYIENGKIARGKLSDEEYKKIAQISSYYVNKDNVTFMDQSNPKVSDIYMKVKAIKETKGLDVIIIDHIGKLKSDLKTDRYNQMTNISNSLKKLAKELDVCVIALCQLSRNVEQRVDKRPMLSDLRDAGTIEEDADMVGFLYRDGYYTQRENGQDIKKDILEFDCQKNRNGKIGTIYFDYHLQTQIIKER